MCNSPRYSTCYRPVNIQTSKPESVKPEARNTPGDASRLYALPSSGAALPPASAAEAPFLLVRW